MLVTGMRLAEAYVDPDSVISNPPRCLLCHISPREQSHALPNDLTRSATKNGR